MLSHWLLFPVVAAAIGWFTNFLAVRMLFRPHRPFGLLGIRVQGLLPKRKREFARNIGATVAEHLLSSEDVKRMLEEPQVKQEMEELLGREVDVFFDEKLAGAVPMVAPFLKGSVADKIKATLVETLGSLMAKEAGVLGEALDRHLDFGALVERKILDFDMRKLEAIVLAVASKELRWIEILGAVLGFAVGVVQVAILHVLSAGS